MSHPTLKKSFRRRSHSQSHGLAPTNASAVADRPARRSGSAHVKYSVSHHMVIKPFLLLSLAVE